MGAEEQKVLEAVRVPRTQIDIAKTTGLSRDKVRKLIHQLERKGLVVSRGATAARKHMALAAAIELLFVEVARLRRNVVRQ